MGGKSGRKKNTPARAIGPRTREKGAGFRLRGVTKSNHTKKAASGDSVPVWRNVRLEDEARFTFTRRHFEKSRGEEKVQENLWKEKNI